MRQRFFLGLIMTLGHAAIGVPSWGQVVEREREVTITGPRGRSIERSFVSERGPAGVMSRQMTVQRPGGTIHSTAQVVRPPSFGRPGPVVRGGFGPRPNVIINNGGGGSSWIAPLAIGGGLLGLGMFAGSALASRPPPPPVYAVPAAPVYVAPAAAPPTVIYNPPQPYVPPPPPQPPTVVIDPVADAMARLQSQHDNSRRDGAYTLGRLRDPRAIPALVDRLKYDEDTDVRIASATALGEIGDPSSAIFLERVTIYDKKQKVRDAAAVALSRLPREVAPQYGQPATAAPPSGPAVTAPSSVPLSQEPYERVPPPPTPVTEEPGFRDNR